LRVADLVELDRLVLRLSRGDARQTARGCGVR
jgi:hypothetical protein